MKTKIFFLLLMLIISIGTLFASDTQVDGIWYNFKSNTLTAEVTYHGASYDAYSNEYSGVVTIPDSVTYSNKTYRVTSIGSRAFWDCTRLRSVTIPNSVTSLGEYAFRGCTGLTSVTIPNSVTSIGYGAFASCSGLISVTIPNSVTSIGSYAFSNCTSLSSVEIPNSVTSIGVSAFNYCTSLNSVEIPNSVTSIEGATFWCCSSLTSVTIPNSVTSIGDQAFGYCTRLTSITVEAENPPILGNKVFDNVNTSNILFYVPTASIPAYQAATQWNSFRISDITFVINGIRYCLYDSTLTASVVHDDSYTGDIVIPSSVTYGNILYSVTSIGKEAFSYCSGLTSVTIPNSVTSIGEGAFSYCSSLTSVTIPNSITYIEKKAFQGCTSLSHFEIPNSVTGIGSYAFQSCTSLSSVTIPNSVISIEVGAFNACTSLTSVTIPNSVTSIGSSPFQGCNNLTGIYATCGDLARIKSLLKNDNRVKYAPLPYALTVNARNGAVSIPQNICDVFELTATPNYGYHFTQWSDGVTDNPRTFVLTQDTSFSVEFARNPTITYIYDKSLGSVSGATALAYDTIGEITFEATPKYGYNFVQWSDGVTDNPRTAIIVQDTTFTAEFVPNKYELFVKANSDIMGNVTGSGVYDYNSDVEVSATPNYGYSFCYWKRLYIPYDAIPASQAYQIASALASGATTSRTYKVYGYVSRSYGYSNSYYISDNPDEEGMFVIYRASKSANIGDIVLVEAKLTNYKGTTPETVEGGKLSILTPDEYSTTCIVHITNDDTIKAYFKANTYTIFDETDTTRGYVSGLGSYDYLTEPTLTAVPNYGYHFTQWSDGIQDNPRNIVLTQDTVFTAVFDVDKSGLCGKDSALTWSYDDKSKTLTITGNGALTDNYTYGAEAPTQMNTLIIGDGVTAIGDSAFYGMTTINHLFIGANVASIGNYAFAECRNFDDITCYATIVPTINATTFANVGNKQFIYLYVPSDRERAYKRDEYWGLFDIQIKSAETTTTDGDVAVVPADNTAEISWPAVNNADTYEIEITKDGVVVCVLKFNANGQLIGLAFAPGRNGANYTQQAQTAGFKFTVTGLTSGTRYGYTIAAKDALEQTVDAKSGTFTTTIEGVTTDIDQVIVPNSDQITNDPLQTTTKLLRNGQILILRGDRTYTLTGQELK